MEGLREVFSGEAEEILRNLEPDIVRLEEDYSSRQETDPEVVNRIFRHIHTLKGSSGMVGLTDVSQFTHKLENLIDAVRSGKLSVNESIIDILLKGIDWIRLAVFGADENAAEDAVQDAAGQDQLRIKLTKDIEQYVYNKTRNTQSKKEEDKNSYKLFRIQTVFKESIFEKGIDPLLLIENLASFGSVSSRKVDRKKLPDMDIFDPEKCYLNWDITIRTKHSRQDIEDVFLFVKDDSRITIEDITGKARIPEKFEASKIGEIMVNENIITENQLTSILDVQEKEGKKIAELVVEKGYASRDDVNYALSEQVKIRKRIESSTIRVATAKLDSLLNLLGEIVIGQSAISRVAEEIGGEDGERVQNAVYSMDRTTREFQEQLMAIRMIPIGPTFEQFKRFVRDTAKEFGKDIILEMEGVETELDKTVIEKINDPLKHMIRNSIDHGIETPEERMKAGKPARGRILLKAYHQEGNVYIVVKDDGRGIDKVKVREKAESIGLVRPSEEISNERLINFLFLPGFSTAMKVGSLSGRGVGMDIVKTNIEQLRGSIKIETEPGSSTTMLIKLPLTMAIIDGMLVRVGKWTYIIPLLSIIESLQPEKSDVKTIEGHGEVINVRGNFISLLRMYDLFGIVPDYKNPWECLVVIVESNGVHVGLMIDELIGQQQIVIKSMDAEITKSRAISGASILGDGTVSLIIDIHGLVGEIAG